MEESLIVDPADGVVTLGVVTGPENSVIEQVREKADVTKAMHAQLELVDDPDPQHVLANSTLNVQRTCRC